MTVEMRFQHVFLLLLALISMSLCFKDITSGEMQGKRFAEIHDYDNSETSRRTTEKFPRVCGIHGWKKCSRRRSSIKVKQISEISGLTLSKPKETKVKTEEQSSKIILLLSI